MFRQAINLKVGERSNREAHLEVLVNEMVGEEIGHVVRHVEDVGHLKASELVQVLYNESARSYREMKKSPDNQFSQSGALS